jgi:hypothetical protein
MIKIQFKGNRCGIKNTEAFSIATDCMLISCEQNAMQNQNVQTGKMS